MKTRQRVKIEQNHKNRVIAQLMPYKKSDTSFFLPPTGRKLGQDLCRILEKLETLSSSRHAFPSSKKSEKNWGSYMCHSSQ